MQWQTKGSRLVSKYVRGNLGEIGLGRIWKESSCNHWVRNIMGNVNKIEETHLHYQVFEAQEAWKCWPGPLGLKMLTGPRLWGREAKKCWQYHGFGAARPKRKLTGARFVAFDVQNADCNKGWRLGRRSSNSLDVWCGWNPKLLTVPRTSKDNRRNAKETIEF